MDIVYVATPPDSHRELALKVLAAGKPVYVEKPMAMNHAECLDMIAAAENAPGSGSSWPITAGRCPTSSK